MRTTTSSCRRQNPLSACLPLPLPASRKWGESLAPLFSWSNFTHWFCSINKLVTFALHLAGEVSNNTLIPSEDMNHWHVGGSGYLPPTLCGSRHHTLAGVRRAPGPGQSRGQGPWLRGTVTELKGFPSEGEQITPGPGTARLSSAVNPTWFA